MDMRLQKASHRLHLLPTANTACRFQRRKEQPYNPQEDWSILSAIDVDTMEVSWQVMVDGNLDNVDADYQGKYAYATCYNSEKGITLAEMTANEQDWAVVFNIKRIEDAVKRGEFKEMQRCTGVSTGATARHSTRYIPISNGPHGIQHRTGRHPLHRQWQVVADRDRDRRAPARRRVRRQDRAARGGGRRARAGLRPLHTAYDGRGNGYTTLFLDSQVCKWNIDKARRAYKGEKVDPIVQKLDVHYQPGHNHSSMGQTKEADGKWLISLNKFSKDRFLNVGPLKPENDQLIDISGDEMKLVHDGPSFAEPHDATIVHRSKINPVSIWSRDDPFFADAVKQAQADGIDLMADAKVIRDGDKVRVYMWSQAPASGSRNSRSNRAMRSRCSSPTSTTSRT